MKNKLLKDVKNFPKEYEQIQNILNERQKLKEEYPYTFLDNRNMKDINFFKRHIKKNSSKLDHLEFLAQSGSDPREDLVKQLISDIPPDVTVLAFNASFEKSVLVELSKQFPKYKKHLQSIINNLVDLAEPFRKKYYYHPEMKGKFSIKIILPLLVPEMEKEYENLEIQNGSEAMQSFANLVKISDQNEINRTRKNLIKYCELDTLAMVKIHDKLVKLCE